NITVQGALTEKFRQAQSLKDKGSWPQALLLYTQLNHPLAYFEVAAWYSWRGACAIGFLFAQEGLRLITGNESPNLRRHLLERSSICAYYVGDLVTGRTSSDILLLGEDGFVDSVRRNYFFYLEPLPCQIRPLEVKCPPLQGVPGTMRPLNPTLCRCRNGYVVTYRTAND